MILENMTACQIIQMCEGTLFKREFLNSLHLLAVDVIIKLGHFPVCVTSV